MEKIIDETIRGVINDSAIILETESAKSRDPKFDINKCNGQNWSLLMYAVWWNRKNLVMYLLSVPGINIYHRDDYGNTALHYCYQVSILELFFSRSDFDVNIQNGIGQTGLRRLCDRGRHKEGVREYLLDARADVLIRDEDGETVLDYALRKGYLGTTKIINNSLYTTLLRIPNNLLLHDIVRMIIEEYV